MCRDPQIFHFFHFYCVFHFFGCVRTLKSFISFISIVSFISLGVLGTSNLSFLSFLLFLSFLWVYRDPQIFHFFHFFDLKSFISFISFISFRVWVASNPSWALTNFLSPAFCDYFTFISIRKEAIIKIQIDSRSKKNTLSISITFCHTLSHFVIINARAASSRLGTFGMDSGWEKYMFGV